MVDRSLVSVARRWWYVLVLCPIVAGLAGLVIVQRIPSVYEADETVAVQPITGTDGVPNMQAAQSLADSYAEQIRAAPILTAAAQSIGLDSTSAGELSNMVQARRLTNTALVRLSVQTTDPGVAAELASAIANTFISQNSQDAVARYTSTQNNLVGRVTQLQNDQDTRNQQIDGLRAEPASPERDAQIARLEDQVAQLQASQAIASRSLQDLQLAAARSGSMFSVVDPATPPTAPIRPNRVLSVFMAILAGVFAGAGLVWLAEHVDDRLTDAERVWSRLQLPTLARIPQAQSSLNACSPTDEAVAAGFAELRSGLLSALRGLSRDERVRVIAVASARDGDGKSVVAANLSGALARTGRQVILVDADLARPTQAAAFNVKASPGLAAQLNGQSSGGAPVGLQSTCIDNLQLLAAGATRSPGPDPSALLLSTRVAPLLEALRARCDVLVLDTPGVLERPEGASLSARADAVVLVLDARHARSRTIDPTLASLRDAGASVVGVVLNRVQTRAAPQTTAVAPDPVPTSDSQTAAAHSARPRELARPRRVIGPVTDGS